MEDFTIFDGIVAGIILISGFLAFSRGVVREVLSIGAWVGAAVIAFIFAPGSYELVYEIPIISGFVGDSCNIALIVAFAVIFILALIVISLFTPLLAGIISGSALGIIDKGFGFLFGLARGILLVVVGLYVYNILVPEDSDSRINLIDDSQTVIVLADSQERLATEVEGSSITEWFVARFEELTNTCSPGSSDDNPVVLPVVPVVPADN
ncbi:MAG: CvpA family protein [Rhodobacteraceae bacterium]|nr:CvpA family protein [Paracoccaceae bacterium]